MFVPGSKSYRILSCWTILVLSFYLLCGYQPREKRSIVISYKGNMGVLISNSNASVLIDGLHEYYGPEYLNTPKIEVDKILEQKDPYANLELALFTHHHRDHYSETLAKNFIQSSLKTRIIGSPQVIRSLDRPRTINAWNKNGMLHVDSARGFTLYAFNIPHTGRQRHASVQNVAYFLKMSNTTILHIGDADTDLLAFRDLNLARVDLAIVPIWFLMSESGIRIIKEIVKPRIVIATHISPGESNSMERYRLPGIETFFFTKINRAVEIKE